MLESGDVLRTWALERLPRGWSEAHAGTSLRYPHCPRPSESDRVSANQLGDHRRKYLEFEGELGDSRGTVIRVAEGTFDEQWETQFGCYVSLFSSIVNGDVELERESINDPRWSLTLRG